MKNYTVIARLSDEENNIYHIRDVANAQAAAKKVAKIIREAGEADEPDEFDSSTEVYVEAVFEGVHQALITDEAF